MIRMPFLRGFLRTLIGLSDRSSPWWGIDRSVMSDIERARWLRDLRRNRKPISISDLERIILERSQ